MSTPFSLSVRLFHNTILVILKTNTTQTSACCHSAAYLVICRLVLQSWLIQDSFNLLMVKVGDTNGFYQTSIHQLFHSLTKRSAKSASSTHDRAWITCSSWHSLCPSWDAHNKHLDFQISSLRKETRALVYLCPFQSSKTHSLRLWKFTASWKWKITIPNNPLLYQWVPPHSSACTRQFRLLRTEHTILLLWLNLPPMSVEYLCCWVLTCLCHLWETAPLLPVSDKENAWNTLWWAVLLTPAEDHDTTNSYCRTC